MGALHPAISGPQVIGVLAWWGVLLAAPLLLLRRWRRHRLAHERQRSSGLEEHLHPNRAWEFGGSGRESPAMRARAGTDAETAARHRAARVSRQTLEPLGRYVDFRRRLHVAVAELEHHLSVLPADDWRIERYPLTGERGNTLLVLGETGVFVIGATYAPGHWDDVVTVASLASKVQQLLPGYPGPVHPAICHPFSAGRPRVWHRADEEGEWVGAWLVGGDSVVEWLEHFGTRHGLGPGDLDRFDQLTRPNWLKAAIRTPPTWPPLPEGVPPARQG